jgi:hypothetical protein
MVININVIFCYLDCFAIARNDDKRCPSPMAIGTSDSEAIQKYYIKIFRLLMILENKFLTQRHEDRKTRRK